MKPYLTLIRPLNLLIMAMTLILVRYCIFQPVFVQNNLPGLMPGWQFLLLIIATLLIAAGGYVINDVLDIEMDKVNKPDKMVIGKYISDVKGKNLHFNLTAAGIAFGLAFSYFAGNILLAVFFVIIPTALFYYSFKYKYMPAVGNLVVALLASLLVIIYWIFEFYHLKNQPEYFIEASRYFHQLNRFLLAFAVFAFITTLTREIIKDAQDIEGDMRVGGRTLPIVIGIPATRGLIIVLELITIGGLAWFQFLLYRTGYAVMAFTLLLTQLLLFYSVYKTIITADKHGFSQLSMICKLIMVLGMLSLVATWFRQV